MDETSLSLIARLSQSADSESWNRLVEIYTPLMKRWLRRYDVQDADADDLVQEVFVVVSREMPTFAHSQQQGAFRSWLRQILVHRLQNFWRARRRRPHATGASSVLERLAQLQDETSPLSRLWNEEHDRSVIAKLMDLVRPNFVPQTWEAFERQFVAGQPPAEIAAELKMGIGSVYMARNRVLNALRREAAGLIDSW
jgi:RNA polymerase sigma factor (sigma-70 family)